MANNILEQLDELYSRWSILDKMGKEMQLKRMWNQMTAAYQINAIRKKIYKKFNGNCKTTVNREP